MLDVLDHDRVITNWEFDIEVPNDTSKPISISYIVTPCTEVMDIQEFRKIQEIVLEKSEIFFRDVKSIDSRFDFDYLDIPISVFNITMLATRLIVEVNEDSKVVGIRFPSTRILNQDLTSIIYKIENDDARVIECYLVDDECTIGYEFDDRRYDIYIIRVTAGECESN